MIRRLRPVRFFYSDAFRAGHSAYPEHERFGFIAQEFGEVFPDSVVQRSDGFFQMNESSVLPYAVRSLQELTDTIADQQRQIDDLKAMVLLLLDRQE